MCPYQLLSSSYWVEGERGCHFSFGQEGGCKKILYDVGGPGILKKNCPFKKISSALSAAVYIMNAALAISRVEP